MPKSPVTLVRNTQEDKILRYAKVCRVSNVMRPYLEGFL